MLFGLLLLPSTGKINKNLLGWNNAYVFGINIEKIKNIIMMLKAINTQENAAKHYF